MDIETLKSALPEAPESNVEHFGPLLISAMAEFDIDTPRRQAAFLAQVGVESQHLTRVTENLNYKASGLRRVWPSRFTAAEAEEYAHQPERIASRAYANRNGNGDEASGDGWRYRGRGLIQITGKGNYAECGDGLSIDLLTNPEWLESAEGAARSAAWFWDRHNINKYADEGDFDGCCDMVNRGRKTKPQGDAIGYPERLAAYRAALEALEA